VFDLQTGRPIAGPPRRPLIRIRLQVRSGDIYAIGIEERTT
jgi:Rieske Fe-S protein